MFGTLGTPEIVIIGIVIILIFGVGKISGIGRDLGSSIKEFRRAVREDEEEEAPSSTQQASVQQPPAAQQPAPPPASTSEPPKQSDSGQKSNIF